MAEVKDREQVTPQQAETAPAAQQETPAETAPAAQQETPAEAVPKRGLKEKWKGIPRKKRRRIVRWVITLIVLAAAAAAALKFFGGGDEVETQVETDLVQYGSITREVSGRGKTKAKSSETITITTAGTVMDVLVAEGDMVTAGTPLFNIDSEAARDAVQKAENDVEGYEKQLRTLEKDIAGLNLAAGYPGKLMDVVTLNPGDTISKGEKVATLSDDTRLRLEQYYSYAYAGDIQVGQTVEVSIPALMTTVPGTVEAVHMVSRITPEGSKLFSAEIIIQNEGSLSAEMTASATVTVNGETVYPYEAGKLEYYRTGDLCSTVNGTIISSSLVDYLQVSAGQVLVRIDGEESEAELFDAQEKLDDAREALETAQKNLDNCNAVAPIDGMIIGLSIQAGDEVAANTAVVTISDISTIIVNATVDERNINYVKAGMSVDLNQYDNYFYGMVDSVSLSSTVNGGVASYPMVISVDNSEGNVSVNSSIRYSLVASQNDNCLVLPIQCVKAVALDDGTEANVVFVKGDRPDNAIELSMMPDDVPEGYWAVPVEIGIQDNFNVEIKSGVEEGTEVFTQVQRQYAWG